MSESEIEPGVRGRRRWTVWLAVLAGVLILLGLVVLALDYTGRPEFCARCHEMQAPVAAWHKGNHANVSCFACHSDPGPLGYLKAHVGDGLRDVYWHFTGRTQINGAYVPRERCLVCHQRNFEKGPLPTTHPPNTADCKTCHGDGIHPGLGLGTPQ